MMHLPEVHLLTRMHLFGAPQADLKVAPGPLFGEVLPVSAIEEVLPKPQLRELPPAEVGIEEAGIITIPVPITGIIMATTDGDRIGLIGLRVIILPTFPTTTLRFMSTGLHTTIAMDPTLCPIRMAIWLYPHLRRHHLRTRKRQHRLLQRKNRLQHNRNRPQTTQQQLVSQIQREDLHRCGW